MTSALKCFKCNKEEAKNNNENDCKLIVFKLLILWILELLTCPNKLDYRFIPKTVLGHFLLPEDPLKCSSSSWSCYDLPTTDPSLCVDNSTFINSSLMPKTIRHKMDNKAVKAVIDKFKRLVSQTDRTDIKANLKVLGILIVICVKLKQ